MPAVAVKQKAQVIQWGFHNLCYFSLYSQSMPGTDRSNHRLCRVIVPRIYTVCTVHAFVELITVIHCCRQSVCTETLLEWLVPFAFVTLLLSGRVVVPYVLSVQCCARVCVNLLGVNRPVPLSWTVLRLQLHWSGVEYRTCKCEVGRQLSASTFPFT